jgi:hypothetical protein
MTENEYYDGVRALGLRHDFENVWRNANGDPVWIQPPTGLTPEARAENLERLRKRLRDEF